MEIKTISGGQSGVDQIGLKVARHLGLPTGGTAPKGWKTENGPKPELATYGLEESWSSNYDVRTEDNVRNSNATVLFGNMSTPGSKCTIRAIEKFNRKYIVNPTAQELLEFLILNNVKVLNVAGNRGSKLTKAQRTKIGNTLLDALSQYKDIPF